MQTNPNSWVDVDLNGLSKLMVDKHPRFALLELIQNGLDANGVRNITIDIEYVGDGRANLTVVDDSPEGFHDLSHAYTLFAESEKKGDPTKRGRFNMGEKMVLAICDQASVISTTGGVEFHADGTRREIDVKRDFGSCFAGTIRMTEAQVVETIEAIEQVILPSDVKVMLNGFALNYRTPILTFDVVLPTMRETEDGFRKTDRKTTVAVYEPHPGAKARIYELGIPVVETGDRYDVDVCVAPSTKILTADLRYVEAGMVRPGDKLVGFDEERSPHRRKFREAEVKDVHRIRRPSYRLTFDDGTSIVCSEDHQWLCMRHGNEEGHGRSQEWRTTKNMVAAAGKRAGSCVAKPLELWNRDDSYVAGYLAAALDGEGCFRQEEAAKGRSTTLGFVQVQNAMLDQVRDFLDRLGIGYREDVRPAKGNWQATVNLQVSGREDILRLLGTTRPVRLLPKLSIDDLGTMPTRHGVRLVRKQFLGDRQVVAIETTTHTFIAEGLASHNCQKVPLNMDRDNVTPAFLRRVRAFVLNETVSRLDQEEASATWAKDALADDKTTPETAAALVTARFGEKAVRYDPSDPEANKIAASKGYTVVPGGTFTGAEWGKVNAADVLPRAGIVTPSPGLAFSADGEDTSIPEAEWTEGMHAIAAYAKRLAARLLLAEIDVKVHRLPFGKNILAAYGPRGRERGNLTLNLTKLGHAWFNNVDQISVDELLIHEFAHHTESDHFSHKFLDAACALGAKMRHVDFTVANCRETAGRF